MRAKALSTTRITPFLHPESLSLLSFTIPKDSTIEVEIVEERDCDKNSMKEMWGEKVYTLKMLEGPYEGYMGLFGVKNFLVEPSNIEEEDILEGNVYPGHEIHD